MRISLYSLRQPSISTFASSKVELRSVENITVGMLADIIQGAPPPISMDDFADWPL